MTMQRKQTATVGNHGGYDYMQLLSDFALVMQDFEWMDEAACRNVDGVNFFPDVSYDTESKLALKLCKECPVKEDCLEFAIVNEIDYGIWGGATPKQRKSLRRHFDRDSL
jgi:WhiB family redox-sensing transcriptional regulator